VWSGRETEGEREGLQLQRSKGFKEERRGQITCDERESGEERGKKTLGSDENGRKRMKKLYFYFRFYNFWWKRERVQKIRVQKRNRNMRTYGNGQIWMESWKIKLKSHNLILSKYTYIK
jgi:hypothetical protein